ncbi:hypothetical protein HPB52_002886 [Rhipicephalus sanguineus]|uniref:Translational activator GCN1 n=1 Tax=Rhipicephalus sanguineus TaxID=34632 RepID=A0A9D4SXE0_RHISA|nr:hypothetical protein HPB52_002886 [Rhipicephalus sanguineus]
MGTERKNTRSGLSEVLGGLGVEKLQTLMPEIISTAERTDIAPHVKDGYVMMFIYLPGVFQKEFTPYISQIINPILKALADENEYVRETALRAGQRMVNMYADTAMTLLLPSAGEGALDDNWRIRYSSVQLLGDLLYKISAWTVLWCLTPQVALFLVHSAQIAKAVLLYARLFFLIRASKQVDYFGIRSWGNDGYICISHRK